MEKQQPYKCIYGITGLLVFFCVFSILMLASSSIHADDDVVDDVNISVPVSCTLNGVGMDTHNATIIQGQVNSSIGESTITAFCNDADGFSIYAIGFSLDDEGETSMISSSVGYSSIIQTGTSKVGNESQWAMKILPDSTNNPLYPITIRDEYSDFYSVPDDYDRVAWRTSSTDVGSYAVGSTFRTTYQAYISPLQAPDTFVGKVKYTLVHPDFIESDALKNAVTIVYDGGGLLFENGKMTNTVKYAQVCEPGRYGYVGSNYQEAMTTNIASGGGTRTCLFTI